MGDPQAFDLDEFADQFMVAIAMHADYQSIGVDGDVAGYQRWADRLHQAVDDGLEEVERRAGGYDE